MSPKQKNTKSSESMIDKTRLKVSQADDSLGRRVLGMGFALIGFVLILGIVVLNIVNNTEPRLDEELNVPKLDKLEAYTNKDKVVLTGEVKDVGQVIIYVNDQMQTNVALVEDDKFEFSYVFPDEGEYKFKAASVEGFPFRKGSEKSDSIKTIVDWTAPSADIKLEYEEEVRDGLVSVTGQAEKEVTLKLVQDGEVMYSVEADEEGNFEIADIKLLAGENEFKVELEDKAGNENVLARRIVVNSLVDGPDEILGQSDIPEASGDLFSSFGLNLMIVFGALSIVALLGSSSVVILKMRKE